jgi:hypothetical protein
LSERANRAEKNCDCDERRHHRYFDHGLLLGSLTMSAMSSSSGSGQKPVCDGGRDG